MEGKRPMGKAASQLSFWAHCRCHTWARVPFAGETCPFVLQLYANRYCVYVRHECANCYSDWPSSSSYSSFSLLKIKQNKKIPPTSGQSGTVAEL